MSTSSADLVLVGGAGDIPITPRATLGPYLAKLWPRWAQDTCWPKLVAGARSCSTSVHRRLFRVPLEYGRGVRPETGAAEKQVGEHTFLFRRRLSPLMNPRHDLHKSLKIICAYATRCVRPQARIGLCRDGMINALSSLQCPSIDALFIWVRCFLSSLSCLWLPPWRFAC